MIRILQVLPSLQSGGVERVTIDTVLGLNQQGFGTHHVASAGGIEEQKLAHPITHHQLPLNTKNPICIIHNGWRLAKIIREHKINLIHVRSRAPAWSVWIASKLTSIPFIATYHGAYSSGSYIKLFYNRVMMRGIATIAISRFIEQHIKNQHPQLASRIIRINEGIDTDVFDPSLIGTDRLNAANTVFTKKKEIPVLLLPGRLTNIKGQVVFLKALQLLTHLKWRAVLIGDDQGRIAYRNELLALAQGLPVTFIERYDDMPAAYAASDIVLSCSTKTESFGRTMAEALAMGKMVIATNHGGSVELSNNGVCAQLVPPNDVGALTVELEKCLTTVVLNPDLTYNAAARQYIADHYSLKIMLDKTKAVYSNLAHL